MTGAVQALDQKPAARVETSLFGVRWVLYLLVIPVAWADHGSMFPSLWLWLGFAAVANLLIGGAFLIIPNPSPRWDLFVLAADAILFGALPFLPGYNGNYLAFFLLFPTIFGAVRFGTSVGLLVAGLFVLPLEIRLMISNGGQPGWGPVTSSLPLFALLGATFLAGYLAKNEKEAMLRQAALDLEDLRHAMAGARLLYKTADALGSSTSYTPVLEAMLEAGVKGLPQGRREDGPPVGIALFFGESDGGSELTVSASKNLDRYDQDRRIKGKEGIVAEALKSGDAVVFDFVQSDPELGEFTSLGHCRSGVCYPLQAGMEQYGVVILATPAPRRPSEQHLELMRAFTNQAALAFQNARLYQDLRIEHDQIIRNENEMRQKLAMDLHDGPTQKVAALAMQIEYIQRLLDDNPREAKLELEKARLTAHQTVKEIRTSLYVLRPLVLETKGLSAALEQYCERLRGNENVLLNMEAGHFGTELDPNVASTVFAIIDEAVNNARKHASSSPIQVRVASSSGALVATVQDKGPGFDTNHVMDSYDKRASLGLQLMRERARLIDGELRIDSNQGVGTIVKLVVPNLAQKTRPAATGRRKS